MVTLLMLTYDSGRAGQSQRQGKSQFITRGKRTATNFFVLFQIPSNSYVLFKRVMGEPNDFAPE